MYFLADFFVVFHGFSRFFFQGDFGVLVVFVLFFSDFSWWISAIFGGFSLFCICLKLFSDFFLVAFSVGNQTWSSSGVFGWNFG